MFNLTRRTWQRMAGLFITAIFILIFLRPNPPAWLERIDYLLYDIRFSVMLNATSGFIKETTDHNIVIIDIDEPSLMQEGHWPWSRSRLSDLVHMLAEAGVAVITFDVVFSEPERNPVNEVRNHIPQALTLIPPKWATLMDGDQHFADSFTDTDVVLGFFFLDQAELKNGTLPKPLMSINESHGNLVVIEKPGYASNIAKLQNKTAGGFVTTFTDNDGIVRRTPLLISNGEYLYPALSLATAMQYLMLDDITLEQVRVGQVDAIYRIGLADKLLRTDALGRVIVPYRGGAKSFPYYSAKDVLNDTLPKGALEGTIALVGTSALGLSDLRTTPLETQYPGVEVHANVIDGLLNGAFPYRPDWEPAVTFIVLLTVGLFLAWVLPSLGPLSVIGVSLLVQAGLIAGNYFLWIKYSLDLPLTMPLLLSFVLSVMAFVQGFLSENFTRRQLRGMFDQYVPPAHIERMMNNPGAYQFDGESKELTVLFSDIRSFTTISEQLSASDLKRMLNEYFTPITKIIFDNDGTIDKYVGDMVMAFWGAPIDDKYHARNAIQAALVMQHETKRLSEIFNQRGWPAINIGIGLNTGTMNVGDMGSSYRRSYTVLGDAVNLGSRLESITKYYGVGILISESTKQQAPEFVCRFIDDIVVKGKEEPIKVYEVLGREGEVDQAILEELNLQEIALAHYRNKEWEYALNVFYELSDVRACTLYDVYIERILLLREQQHQGLLPDNWDGVFRHTEK